MPKSPDIVSVDFAGRMMECGDDINLTLSHNDSKQLKEAVESLKTILAGYSGVKDISDSESESNPEYAFSITREAKAMGLTPYLVVQQLRGAFQGIDVFSIPKQTEDIDVVVILPKSQRESLNILYRMKLSNSAGKSIPLMDAVTFVEGVEPLTIRRINRSRVIEVTGKFKENLENTDSILQSMLNNDIPKLKNVYPGLSVKARGAREEQTKSMNSLIIGFLLAMLGIYSLLAIFFKSYTQPLVVMIAIPFGIAGALGGHYWMGYSVSSMSLFGIVGLSGVVVNDSLILVNTVNSLYQGNKKVFDALVEATMMRFRPIMLTSLTTFFGLAPILMEDSIEAQFLIPTAISLGVGILFGTVVILAIVLSLYLILHDVKSFFRNPDSLETLN